MNQKVVKNFSVNQKAEIAMNQKVAQQHLSVNQKAETSVNQKAETAMNQKVALTVNQKAVISQVRESKSGCVHESKSGHRSEVMNQKVMELIESHSMNQKVEQWSVVESKRRSSKLVNQKANAPVNQKAGPRSELVNQKANQTGNQKPALDTARVFHLFAQFARTGKRYIYNARKYIVFVTPKLDEVFCIRNATYLHLKQVGTSHIVYVVCNNNREAQLGASAIQHLFNCIRVPSLREAPRHQGANGVQRNQKLWHKCTILRRRRPLVAESKRRFLVGGWEFIPSPNTGVCLKQKPAAATVFAGQPLQDLAEQYIRNDISRESFTEGVKDLLLNAFPGLTVAMAISLGTSLASAILSLTAALTSEETSTKVLTLCSTFCSVVSTACITYQSLYPDRSLAIQTVGEKLLEAAPQHFKVPEEQVREFVEPSFDFNQIDDFSGSEHLGISGSNSEEEWEDLEEFYLDNKVLRSRETPDVRLIINHLNGPGDEEEFIAILNDFFMDDQFFPQVQVSGHVAGCLYQALLHLRQLNYLDGNSWEGVEKWIENSIFKKGKKPHPEELAVYKRIHDEPLEILAQASVEVNDIDRQDTSTIVQGVVTGIVCLFSIVAAALAFDASKVANKIPQALNFFDSVIVKGPKAVCSVNEWVGSTFFGKESEKEVLHRTVKEKVDRLLEFCSTNTAQLHDNPGFGCEFEREIRSARDLLTSMQKDHPLHLYLLNTIQKADKRWEEVRDIYRSSAIKFVPVAPIFFGEPGIGKTYAKNKLARQLDQMCFNGEGGNYAISAKENFFPVYTGAKIGVVQEFGALKEMKEDLIAQTFTSICSQEFFNMESAFVKFQPCALEFLLMDSNLPPSRLLEKIPLSKESHQAFAERAIWIEALWKDRTVDIRKVDRENRGYKEDMSHLCFNILQRDSTGGFIMINWLPYARPKEWKEFIQRTKLRFTTMELNEVIRVLEGSSDPQSKAYVSLLKQPFSFPDLVQLCYYHWCIHKRNFQRLVEHQTSANDLTREAGMGVMSVCLYGHPGEGKTFAVNTILQRIRMNPAVKVYYAGGAKIDTTEPCVLVVDDFIKDGDQSGVLEDVFFNTYNSLPDNSLVLFCSNIIPKRKWCLPGIKVDKESRFGISTFQRNYFAKMFRNAGTYRRAGYNGEFDHDGVLIDSTNNYCFNVSGWKYRDPTNAEYSLEHLCDYIIDGWYQRLTSSLDFEVIYENRVNENADLVIKSPSFDQLKKDLSSSTSLARILLGASSTKIKYRPALAHELRGCRFNTWTIGREATRAEMAKHYMRVLRSAGIPDNIYVDLGDVTVYCEQNRIYMNENVRDNVRNIEIKDGMFNIDNVSIPLETAVRLSMYEELCGVVDYTILKPELLVTTRNYLVQCQLAQVKEICQQLDQQLAVHKSHERRRKMMEFMQQYGLITLGAGLAAVIGIGAITYFSFKKKKPSPETGMLCASLLSEGRKLSEELESSWSRFSESERQVFIMKAQSDTIERQKRKIVGYDENGNPIWADVKISYPPPPNPDWGWWGDLKKDPNSWAADAGEFDYEQFKGTLNAQRSAVEEVFTNKIEGNLVSVMNKCYGIGLYDRYFISVRHVDAEDLFIVDHRCGEKQFKAKLAKGFEHRDVAIYKVEDKTFPSFKDIRRLLIPRGMKFPTGTPISLYTKSQAGFIEHNLTVNKHISVPRPDQHGKLDKDYLTSFVYDSMRPTTWGDCGMPYLLPLEAKFQKPCLAGIHFAATRKDSDQCPLVYTGMIFLDDIQDLDRQVESNEYVLSNGVKVEGEKIKTAIEKGILVRIAKEWPNPNQLPTVIYDGEEYRCKPDKVRVFKSLVTGLAIQNGFETKIRELLTVKGSEFPLIKWEKVQVINILDHDASPNPDHDFVKTPFFGEAVRFLGQPKRIPIKNLQDLTSEECSMLRKLENGTVSQIAFNAWYLEDPVKNMPSDLYNLVKEAMQPSFHMMFGGYLDFSPQFVVLTGIRPFGYGRWPQLVNKYRGLELDSSTGFFCKEIHHLSKKSDYFENHGGVISWKKTRQAQEVHDFYKFNCELVRNGVRPINVFTSCKKVEHLPSAKAYRGRIFEANDLVGTLLERYVFGLWCASNTLDDMDNPCRVGIDAHADWQQLYDYHMELPNHFAGDFNRFDKRIPESVSRLLFQLMEESSPNPIWKQAVKAMYESVFHSYRVVHNTIVCARHSIPSGTLLTAPADSWMVTIMYFMCFVITTRQCSWNHFREHVRISTYGDDNLVSVSDQYKDIFNLESCSKILAEMGVKLDSDRKDGALYKTTRDITQCTFLSRHFRRLNGFVIGALKQESIEARLYWTRKTACGPTDLVERCRTALIEATCWGEEYYNKINKVIRSASRSVQLGNAFRSANIPTFKTVEGFLTSAILGKRQRLKNSEALRDFLENDFLAQFNDFNREMEGSRRLPFILHDYIPCEQEYVTKKNISGGTAYLQFLREIAYAVDSRLCPFHQGCCLYYTESTQMGEMLFKHRFSHEEDPTVVDILTSKSDLLPTLLFALKEANIISFQPRPQNELADAGVNRGMRKTDLPTRNEIVTSQEPALSEENDGTEAARGANTEPVSDSTATVKSTPLLDNTRIELDSDFNDLEREMERPGVAQRLGMNTARPTGGNGRLLNIDDGETEPHFAPNPSTTMRRDTTVDDFFDVTAEPLNMVAPLEQATPSCFKYDAWHAWWTGQTQLVDTQLSSSVEKNFIIGYYSTDPNSPYFPSGEPGSDMALKIEFIKSHKFFTEHFRIKAAIVAATGTIGRYLVAELPAGWRAATEAAGGTITCEKIYNSGFPFEVLTLDGDQTVVVDLKPIVNSGFSSATNPTEQVISHKEFAILLETPIDLTYKEGEGQLWFKAWFEVGECFSMTVPLKGFSDVVKAACKPPENPKVTPQYPGVGELLLVENGQDLVVGSKAFKHPSFLSEFKDDKTPFVELEGGEGTAFDEQDVYCFLPVKNANGFGLAPIYMRGDKPDLDLRSLFKTYAYKDWINGLCENKLAPNFDQVSRVHAGVDLAMALYEDPAKKYLRGPDAEIPVSVVNGELDSEITTTISTRYDVILCQTGSTKTWLIIPVMWDDSTGEAHKIESFNDENGFYLKYVPSIVDMDDSGCSVSAKDLLITMPNFSSNNDLLLANVYDMNTWASATKKEPLLPFQLASYPYRAIKSASRPLIETLVYMSGAQSNRYQPLTLSESSYSTTSEVGRGANPSKAHFELVSKLLDRINGPSDMLTFNIVDRYGGVLATAGFTMNEGLLINATEVSKVLFTTTLYITNLNHNSATIPVTPTSEWGSTLISASKTSKSVRWGDSRKKFNDLERQAAVLGALGGILGGVGQGMQHVGDQKWQAEQNALDREQLEANRKLQEQLRQMIGDQAMAQLQESGKLNQVLSAQEAVQTRKLENQKFGNNLLAHGATMTNHLARSPDANPAIGNNFSNGQGRRFSEPAIGTNVASPQRPSVGRDAGLYRSSPASAGFGRVAARGQPAGAGRVGLRAPQQRSITVIGGARGQSRA